MRIFSVAFALLLIAVTSLARPQETEDASKTTTAVPSIPTIKRNDTPSGTPASMGKSNEKPNSVIAHTTPSVIVAGKLKESTVINTVPIKTPVTPVTSDSKADLSSAIASSDKISTSTTTPTIPTTSTTTTTPIPTTITTTTAVPTNKTATTTAAASTTTTTTEITTEVSTTGDTTTTLPPTPTCPPPDRHFDGLSFLGGIILTICLIGIGIFLCKYCQHVCEDKYRTL